MKPHKTISTKDAAPIAGFSQATIARWAKQGIIVATRNGKWKIDQRYLEAYVGLCKKGEQAQKYKPRYERIILSTKVGEATVLHPAPEVAQEMPMSKTIPPVESVAPKTKILEETAKEITSMVVPVKKPSEGVQQAKILDTTKENIVILVSDLPATKEEVAEALKNKEATLVTIEPTQAALPVAQKPSRKYDWREYRDVSNTLMNNPSRTVLSTFNFILFYKDRFVDDSIKKYQLEYKDFDAIGWRNQFEEQLAHSVQKYLAHQKKVAAIDETKMPPVAQSTEAVEEITPEHGYWYKNLETGKIELYIGYVNYKALPKDQQDDIKSNFNFSRGKEAWMSKASQNTYRAEEIAQKIGLQYGGALGAKISFGERLEQESQRAEKRMECMYGASARAKKESEAAYKRSGEAVTGIEVGQPILVGHHSEKRHRAALEKAWNAMGKSVEEQEKAKYYAERAMTAKDTAEQAELDDPAFLMRRIAENETMIRKFKRENLPQLLPEYVEKLNFYRKKLEESGGARYNKETLTGAQYVKFMGSWHPVVRLNPKSATISNWLGIATFTYQAPYPEIKDAAFDVEAVTVMDRDGKRVLPSGALIQEERKKGQSLKDAKIIEEIENTIKERPALKEILNKEWVKSHTHEEFVIKYFVLASKDEPLVKATSTTGARFKYQFIERPDGRWAAIRQGFTVEFDPKTQEYSKEYMFEEKTFEFNLAHQIYAYIEQEFAFHGISLAVHKYEEFLSKGRKKK